MGRPPRLYKEVLLLLNDVYQERITPEALMKEILRSLLILKNERDRRIQSLVRGLKSSEDSIPLSSEDITTLVEQHITLKGTSRIGVLIVAAIYQTAEQYLKEKALTLHSHNAADVQTGALGDVEITLIDDNRIVTTYEVKNKRVTHEDINSALQKISHLDPPIDNYIFITTEEIDNNVQEYARSIYQQTGGIEFVILDCIGFLRHFLHLFHRLRTRFIEIYQKLLLNEPESSVSQPVKEAFLAMRQAAEADYGST